MTKGRCPICDKPILKEFKPFCSKRCADADLAKWLTGSYAVPVVETDDETDGPDAPETEH